MTSVCVLEPNVAQHGAPTDVKMMVIRNMTIESKRLNFSGSFIND
jgi:hypothetical protein